MSHAKPNGIEASKAVGTQAADSDTSLPQDDVFDALSNGRRRQVILTLHEHKDLRKQELVELVTAALNDMTLEEVPGTDERQSVHTSLHQRHLPKLDELGIIEWDEEGDRISLGPHASQLDDYLPKLKDSSLGSKIKQSINALC